MYTTKQIQKKLQKKISKQEDKLQNNLKPKPLKEKYDIKFLEIFKESHKKSFCIDEKKCEIDGKFLWSSPRLTFSSGDKVLIKGKNGSGKTTFLNYVKESIPSYLQVAYFEQNNFDIFEEEKKEKFEAKKQEKDDFEEGIELVNMDINLEQKNNKNELANIADISKQEKKPSALKKFWHSMTQLF